MYKIKLIQLGHMPYPINFNYIKKFKSSLFEIIPDKVIDELSQSNANNGHDYSTYYDTVLENDIPEPNDGIDFVLAITNCGLEGNFYARRLGGGKAVLSFRNIYDHLTQEHIPLENAILKMLYEYCLGFDRKVKNFDMSLIHDETRACLFDMTGNISDVRFSFNQPQICVQCLSNLQKRSIPTNSLKKINCELKKLKRPIFYRTLDWVKKHPLLSLLISSVFAIIINILSTLVYNLLII